MIWRRDRWMPVLGVMAALLVLAACASVPAAPPASVPEPTATILHGSRHGTEVAQPSPFLVRYDQTELQLQPVTYCYRTGCLDGVDEDPPSVGSPEEIFVFVPVGEFDTLHVGQLDGEDPCVGRSVAAEVASLGGGWWSVRPRGPAADYRVELFAGGEGAGDMIASIRWQTPKDEALPDPTASLTLVVDHDGVPDSYGLELMVGNLTESPAQYSATITATASNGRSLTFDATSSGDCQGEGSLFFDGPDAEARRAAALGGFPFELEVELVLEGVSHVARATYPDDVAGPNDISVPLVFTPELP